MKKPSQIFDTPQATGFDRVTHNTREGIEEAVDDYLAITKVHPSIDKRKQLIGAFHQELQKAREEERERILLAIARIGKIDFRLSDVLDAINQSDKKCIMKKIEEYNEVMTQEELQALTQPNNK